jgi:hypothetical protein
MSCRVFAAIALVLLCAAAPATADVAWLPAGLPPPPAEGPALCPGGFLKSEQGRAVLDAALAQFPDRASWQAYTAHVRLRIQQGAGLAPWPRRTPLNAIIRARRECDGYTVENVAFESVPGSFVTGNLYRALAHTKPFPVILATHGHTNKITKPDDYDRHGRFAPYVQARCGALARMGAVVLAIDMFGCGDSIGLVGAESHRRPFTLTIQCWNAIRALDFLLALDGADPRRVGVTGESGGGTQSFLLTALDARVTLSVPVVMVSSYFFGGCQCESGLPIHRSADHFVSNAMIAAMAAPRPMLVVSDGKDWTQHVPEIEFPFLKKIYAYYGAESAVANVHLPTEGHDYGPSKRAAMYRFVAERFGLDLAAVQGPDGQIDESRLAVVRAGALHVFSDEFPLPAHALRDPAAIEQALRALQTPN